MIEARPRLRFAVACYAVGFIVAAVTLVTCSRHCHAAPLSTEAGFRAALERLP